MDFRTRSKNHLDSKLSRDFCQAVFEEKGKKNFLSTLLCREEQTSVLIYGFTGDAHMGGDFLGIAALSEHREYLLLSYRGQTPSPVGRRTGLNVCERLTDRYETTPGTFEACYAALKAFE